MELKDKIAMYMSRLEVRQAGSTAAAKTGLYGLKEGCEGNRLFGWFLTKKSSSSEAKRTSWEETE